MFNKVEILDKTIYDNEKEIKLDQTTKKPSSCLCNLAFWFLIFISVKKNLWCVNLISFYFLFLQNLIQKYVSWCYILILDISVSVQMHTDKNIYIFLNLSFSEITESHLGSQGWCSLSQPLMGKRRVRPGQVSICCMAIQAHSHKGIIEIHQLHVAEARKPTYVQKGLRRNLNQSSYY